MRRWMVACALGCASAAFPPSLWAAAPALFSPSVVSDPHYATWRTSLAEASTRARALIADDEAARCGSADAIRPLTFQARRARQALLGALAARGVEPAPAPGAGIAWPWGPGIAHPRVTVVDSMDIAIYVDDGRLLELNLNGALEVDPFEAAQAFYADHDDEYDFLFLFTNFYTELFGGQLLAYHLAVANDVGGLGYVHVFGSDHFNDGPDFTNNAILGQLQSFVHLGNVRDYPAHPASLYWRDYTAAAFMAHEISHRWGARIRLCSQSGPPLAMLGRSNVHWSFFFDSRSSVLEGNAWEGDVAPYVSGTPTAVYSPLDLYLMGMLAESDIATSAFWYVANPRDCSPSVDSRGNPWAPASAPTSGVLCDGDRIDFDLACIQAANGGRVPSYPEAPRDFRVATMLLTSPNTPVQQSDLDKLAALRQELAGFFSAQTQLRGNLDFHLDEVPARVLFEHLPQGDVEDPAAPIPIRTRIALDPRSLPTTLDDVRLLLHTSIDGGDFIETPMTAEAPDTWSGAIPAQALGTQVRYYLRATTILSEHEHVLPAGAPGATFTFDVVPDTAPPMIAHVPVRSHSRNAEPVLLRSVVRDPHFVASVTVEYGPSGGAMQTQSLARQGTTEVWETRLQLPGDVGDRIDYRIVARDAALELHQAILPTTGFYSIDVTLEQFESVEFEDPLWTHRSLKYEGPDEWHPGERQNVTPSGRFCWKLGPTNLSTNPRVGQMALEQDAVLEGPAVYLREGWQMTFYHRYYLRLSPQGTDPGAMDGAIVEVQYGPSPPDPERDRWWLVDPDDGYPWQFGAYAYFNPLQWYPCFSGQLDSWQQKRISSYPALDNSWVRFRFRVTSSIAWPNTIARPGYYLDDIVIDPGLAVPVTLDELQGARTADGVRLSWRARDLEASDVFRISRATLVRSPAGQDLVGPFEPVGTVDAHPSHHNYVWEDTDASVDQVYVYRITLVRGLEATSREVTVGSLVVRFALHPNRPNPFNPSTEIAFDLPERGATSLIVYDVRGERVRALANGVLAAGPHRLRWDGMDDTGRAAASGVYLCALESASQRATRRLLLLR